MIDAERSPLAFRENGVGFKEWESGARSVDELEEEIAEEEKGVRNLFLRIGHFDTQSPFFLLCWTGLMQGDFVEGGG